MNETASMLRGLGILRDAPAGQAQPQAPSPASDWPWLLGGVLGAGAMIALLMVQYEHEAWEALIYRPDPWGDFRYSYRYFTRKRNHESIDVARDQILREARPSDTYAMIYLNSIGRVERLRLKRTAAGRWLPVRDDAYFPSSDDSYAAK